MVPRALTGLSVAVAVLALAACGGDEHRDGGRAATTATSPVPALPRGLVLGIGEQGTAMFSDPRFEALRIDRARLVTSYDSARVRFERGLVDAWLAAARRAGVEPFIAFWHSRVHPRRLPSVAEFRSAFRAFRERYPEVRIYSAWNEPNHGQEPTRRAPQRAADYFDIVRSECPNCTVVAGDLVDAEGTRRYLAEYRRSLDSSPRVWGLHNYSDANRFRESGLRKLLATVPGDVWLTETGGLVRFGERFPHDEQRAARAVAFVLRLAARFDRIKRVYLYNWTASGPAARFDSGLMGRDGAPRPAYEVLREAVGGGGRE